MRDLPWRRIRDPWPILVAEVMLQQTQVVRVIPRWESFLGAYPHPADCARAPLGDVLRLWHGLGYPRRARDLHRAATLVVDDHDGLVPADLPSLLALPGVGPYTARAVQAFAFERDVGVVDTNIARVLARVHGERLTGRRAQELADREVPPGHGWEWNQVLMDLGATICRPHPACGSCPTRATCTWALSRTADDASTDPADPATGSAGVSARQSPYAGSAREARGRVLADLVAGTPVPAGEDPVVTGLLADGLVVERGGRLHLPD